MGKFDGVLLISDFDDTLYGFTLTVTPKTHEAIDYFLAEGGTFTIATGRALNTFTPQIEKERLRLNAPVILSNGAAIYDYGAKEYLKRTCLPLRAAEDMQALSDAFRGGVGLEVYHNEDIYIVDPNRFTDYHMARVGTSWRTVRRMNDIPDPYVKIIIEGPNEKLLKAQEMVLERWSEHYEAIFSNAVLLEITEKGANKGGMAAWLRDYLGVKPEHVYCVGDNQNDLSMLQIAAVGYAPENATRHLKDWGAVILPDCDHDTVAALIEELDKRY